MQVEDLAAVCEIEKITQPTPWNEGIFRDCLRSDYDCEVVERDGKLVAFQVVSRVLDEAHLLNVAVAPAWQRRGIAWALLKRMFERCTERDISVIFLEVRASNHGAQALYEKLGFAEAGRRNGYYRMPGGREDALLMMMQLSAHN